METNIKSDKQESHQFQESFYILPDISTAKEQRRRVEDPINKEIINFPKAQSIQVLYKNLGILSKEALVEPTNKGPGLLKDAEPVGLLKYADLIKKEKFFDHIMKHKQLECLRSRKSIIEDLSGTASRGKCCASQNIGVLSMTFDVPLSEPLSALEAAGISCALQECLNVLKILECTIPAKVDKRWEESYKSIREKYGDLDETGNIFREDMGFLPLIPTAAEKLQRDRTYIYKVFEETLDDVKKHRKFDRLEMEVDNIAKTVEKERALQIDYEIWTYLVDQLKDLIDSQKIKNEKELKHYTELAHNADVEADNSIFLNGSKLEYVKQWEEDRLNQQNLKMVQEEEEITNELNENGKAERAEQIVSEEIQTYLQNSITELEDEIKEWNNKYNEEIQTRQMEIYDLREMIDEEKQNLKETYKLYDERQAFIDECYAEKARIKRQEEYWKGVHRAATIIQSLWRGHMVRNQLGEYKGLWARLKKRKKLAAITRKKREAWQKKKAKQWGETKLKTMKNIVDPNA